MSRLFPIALSSPSVVCVRTRRTLLGVALALTCLVVPSVAVGQSAPSTGTIAGTVLDPAGQPAPGATVTARSASGFVRSSVTGARGRFDLGAVTPGPYDVTVTLDGFRADTTRVAVRSGESAEIELPLRLSAVTETIVVSASYAPTPISEVPSGTSVVTRRDLDARQIVTVAEALQLAPGMAVAANGGAGSVTSVFPRGGESDFTLILVDGVKLNSFGGGFDFGHLTTAGLSSLEVVRGPQSAVFGAGAIGGVIQLRTLAGGPASASAAFESGNYGADRAAASAAGSRGRAGWGVHVERLSSDGWTDNAPGTTQPVSNDDDRATMVALAGTWQASPRTSVRVDSRFGSNERGYPGPFGSNPIGAFPGIDTVSRGRNALALGSVSMSHEWSARTSLRVQGSWMQLDSEFASPWGDSTSGTQRWAVHGQVDRALSDTLAVSAGIDAERERADSTYITGEAASPVPVERWTAGYFAEARLRARARLFVTAGFRIEQIARAALEADPFGWTPRPALPAETLVSPNPRVAASYFVRTSGESGGNWTRAHASAGTGIRAPDAFEIAFTDNPALKPERSRSVDAGLEQGLLGGRLVLDGTVFSNSYDDLIVAVGPAFANASRYRTDNIANARARGVELSAAWRTRQGLEVRAQYSFVDSSVLAVDRTDGAAPPPFSVGDPLIRRPRHQVSADLLVVRSRWSAWARAVGRGRVLDVEPNYGAYGGLFSAAGFTVVDAGASVRLSRHAEVYGRIGNLLDRAYESAFGFPAQRRTATIWLRLAAGR